MEETVEIVLTKNGCVAALYDAPVPQLVYRPSQNFQSNWLLSSDHAIDDGKSDVAVACEVSSSGNGQTPRSNHGSL